MVKYQTDCGMTVYVLRENVFEIGTHGRDSTFNREQLTELRHIIDQALNTSAEELGDA